MNTRSNAGRRTRWLHALLLAAACGFTADVGAANGSGYFRGTPTFSGAPYAIKVIDAYAYRDKAPTDPAAQVTTVILADKPLDAAAITTALDREAAIGTQMVNAHGSYITLSLNDGDDSPGLSIHVDGVPGNTAMSGGFKVTPTTTDARHVAGHFSSDPKARKNYSADVDFAVAIAMPDPGAALPAGGGDAGGAYVAYAAAVRRGDVQAIANGMQKDRAAAFLSHRHDKDFKQMLGLFQAMAPKEIHVLGGILVGKEATLDVLGRDASGNEVNGKVRLLDEGDGWRIADEHLTTVLK